MCCIKIVFLVIESPLLLMFILAIFMGLSEWIKRRRRKLSYLNVKRGEESMKAIYTGFAICVVFYTTIVQMAIVFNEYKILFHVFNYIVLVYLFFFSSWFRNRIFFKILKRIHKD